MKNYNNASSMFYYSPANVWNESLPLGNGKIGAMVFGRYDRENIELNYDELWTGYPNEYYGEKGKDILEEARKLCMEGDVITANELIRNKFARYSAEAYMPLGCMHLDYYSVGAENYIRDLDLETATAHVEYDDRNKGGHFTREMFVSAPDKAFVMKLTATDGGKLRFLLTFSSKQKFSMTTEDGILLLDGECIANSPFNRMHPGRGFMYSDEPEKRGIRYRAAVTIKTDGTLVTDKDFGLEVYDATEAVIILTAESSFNGFDKHPFLEGKEYQNAAIEMLKAASAKSYDELLEAHLKDYKELYDRVQFDLGFGNTGVATDVRLEKHYQGEEDLGLTGLLFNFGRYLTIASSRAGTQVTNLQGIWNDSIDPPWHCNCTTNINTEMNYYPTLQCNLAECYEPFLKLVKDISVAGKKTAEILYDARGFVCHHNTDLWRKTTPTSGDPRWLLFPGASGWMCNHAFEYYEFTGDKDYLKNELFPILESSAEFYLDNLTDDGNGNLILCPATSPENTYWKNGVEVAVAKASTMTMSIIEQLFANLLTAAKELDINDKTVEDVSNAYEKLLPFRIGKKGDLIEWYDDEEYVDEHHRHVSHLYALHPGHLIRPDKTPELADACRKTLEFRGDDGTGWSLGWKINFWARLFDGNHAANLIDIQLRPSKPDLDYFCAGGTYPNMFDAHPPFQIDGNFGAASGICEMLLQSDRDSIILLPALPDKWADGYIKGLRTVGGATVDIEWKNGKLTSYNVTGNKNNIKIVYDGKVIG